MTDEKTVSKCCITYVTWVKCWLIHKTITKMCAIHDVRPQTNINLIFLLRHVGKILRGGSTIQEQPL